MMIAVWRSCSEDIAGDGSNQEAWLEGLMYVQRLDVVENQQGDSQYTRICKYLAMSR